MLKQKKERHIRVSATWRRGAFLYVGYLTCGHCEAPVYSMSRGMSATATKRVDYYVCREKRERARGHAGARSGREFAQCESCYMRKERLEAEINRTLAERLVDPAFMSRMVGWYNETSNRRDRERQLQALRSQISKLTAKRDRILEAFFDGTIASSDRDFRLNGIDSEISRAQTSLAELGSLPALTADFLADIARPFYTWALLEREDKRAILNSLLPQIIVKDYRVIGMYLPKPSGQPAPTEKSIRSDLGRLTAKGWPLP